MFNFISSAHASETPFERGVMKVTDNITDLIFTPIMWILIGVSVVMFLWGTAGFILSSDSAVKENGKRHMIWGIIGLFIIVSVWGIIGLLDSTVQSFV